MKNLTVSDYLSLYQPRGLLDYLRVRWRPVLCPFTRAINAVPDGGNVLDIGCGMGLFLLQLAAEKKITRAVGVDASAPAIIKARAMVQRLRAMHDAVPQMDFHITPTSHEWPAGPFDTVTMIDVLHHIPPPQRDDFIKAALARVVSGGVVVIKDMNPKPWWAAWFNRLHDLIFARQFVHYTAPAIMAQNVTAHGFVITQQAQYQTGLYAHYLLVARKT